MHVWSSRAYRVTSSKSGVGRVGWCQFECGVLQEAVIVEKRSPLL